MKRTATPDLFSPLILIGERLNTSRERFNTLVTARDAAGVIREAHNQVKSGASHLDVSTSHSAVSEANDMNWLLRTILPELPLTTGICVDAPSTEGLNAALELLQGRTGTIFNAGASSPQDAERKTRLCIDAAAELNAGVIVMLARSEGRLDVADAPAAVAKRVKLAEELHSELSSAGIPDERQFFDPQVVPVAFDPLSPRVAIDTVAELHRRWPDAHLAAGISNVSFNMPGRGVLNGNFLAMLLASGLDTVICDPCSKGNRAALAAARALLGQDDFLASYLSIFAPED